MFWPSGSSSKWIWAFHVMWSMLVQMPISFVHLHASFYFSWYGYIAVWNILDVFNGKELLCGPQIPFLCEMKHCIVPCTISLYCETWPLCSLHYAVCRKCIYKKLNDEDLDHCPVCKIDLGCTPVEKLRYSSCDLSL